MIYLVTPSSSDQGHDETGFAGSGGGNTYPKPQPGDPGEYITFAWKSILITLGVGK